MAELRDIVVSILTKDGVVCGGAFLAPPLQPNTSTHVITCAHVVNAALGQDREKSDRPEDKVRLRLPGSSNAVWGNIVEWHPPRPYDELQEKPVSDIAVLQTDQPTAVRGSSIARAAVSSGSRIRAFGFPGWKHGMPAEGVVLERDNGGWLHVRGIGDNDYFIEEGFSGTPVVAFAGDEVFGIITAVSDKPGKSRAFVIPPNILQQAWPLLAQPYRGLSAFREEDEGDFFGRAKFGESLLERVRAENIVLIFGASGSGKSSVLFAGLLPRIRKLGWHIAHFRPGARPLHALAHAIAPFLEPNGSPAVRIKCAREWASLLAGDAMAIHDVAAAINKDQLDQPLLLIADQFEELFTLCSDEAERTAFANVIREVGSGQRESTALRLVATLRADFSGQVSGDLLLGPVFHGRWLDLPAMDKWQIAEAITQPARQLGVSFQTGLSETILSTMLRGFGLLPLMEFALDQLWQKQAERCLRVADYEAIGGLEGALARHADEALSKLTSHGHGEEQVRRALLQLVRVALPGEGEDAKRQQTRSELGEDLWPIARALADERLVVTSRDPAGNETVDLVHEALIRNWGRLRDWLEEDRKFLRWRQITEAHAARWLELGKTSDLLLRDSLLLDAEVWQTRDRSRMSEILTQLMSASRAAQNSRKARVEADEIWGSLELRDSPLPAPELAALWRLIEATPSTKREFIDATGRSDARARKLVRRSAMVVRAAVGLNLQLRLEISQSLGAILFQENVFAEAITASIMAAQDLSLPIGEILVVNREHAQAVMAGVLRAVKATTDPDQLLTLGQTALALAEKLPAAQAEAPAQAVMAGVLRAVKATTDPDQLQVLGRTAVALAQKLSSLQSEELMASVLRAVGGTTDPDQLQALGQTAVALTEKLSAAQAEAALPKVLHVVKGTSRPYQLQALGKTAVALAKKLSAAQAEDAADAVRVEVLRTVQGMTDPDQLQALGQTAVAVAELSASQAEPAVRAVMTGVRQAVRGMTDPDYLRTLGQTALALEAQPDAAAWDFMTAVLEAVKGTNDPDALQVLGRTAVALAEKMSASRHGLSQAVMAEVVWAAKITTDPDQLQVLGRTAVALAEKVSASQAEAAAQAVMTALLKAVDSMTHPHQLQALGRTAVALAKKLSAAQAEWLMKSVLLILEDDNHWFQLEALAQMAMALAEKVSGLQARAGVQAMMKKLLEAMQGLTKPDQLLTLGQTAVALAEKLSAKQAEDAAQVAVAGVLRAIGSTTDPYQLQALGQTAVALAKKLSAKQAEDAAQVAVAGVLRAIGSTTDPYQLQALGQTAVALAQKLSSLQSEELMASVLRAVGGTTDPDQLQALGQTAVALVEKLPQETTQAAADLFRVKLPSLDGENAALAIVQLAHSALRNASDDAYVRELLDLLKFPATLGPATDFVLGRLRERFANLNQSNLQLWDIIAWAEATFPNVDLTCPPGLPPPAELVSA